MGPTVKARQADLVGVLRPSVKPDLIHGDSVAVMQEMAREGQDFELVYLDPLYFTGEVFKTADGAVAFNDRWTSIDEYLHATTALVGAGAKLLSEAGSIVVHVNPVIAHHIRAFLDKTLGRLSFMDEIVWRYRRWPAKTRRCQRVHDTLIRYAVYPNKARWNQLYEPLAESTRATWGSGRQRAVVKDGRRVRSETSEEESKGVPIGDVWDIGIIAPSSAERTGYPTQKPEALMRRLIEAFTDPGDRILDPTCGSGTTLKAARDLGRSATGIDCGEEAIRTTEARLGITARRTTICMADGHHEKTADER